MNDRPRLSTGTGFGLLTRFISQGHRPASEEKNRFMANRKGVFIGAYVPNELKESLRRRAAGEHRTLSQEITRILVEAVHGKGLPTGSVDRRGTNHIPRRRATDPPIRRRVDDLPYIPSEKKK
jgi:plasmid stability protein